MYKYQLYVKTSKAGVFYYLNFHSWILLIFKLFNYLNIMKTIQTSPPPQKQNQTPA